MLTKEQLIPQEEPFVIDWKRIQIVFLLFLVGQCMSLLSDFLPYSLSSMIYIFSSLIRLAGCCLLCTVFKGQALIGAVLYLVLSLFYLFRNVIFFFLEPSYSLIEFLSEDLLYNLNVFAFDVLHYSSVFPWEVIYWLVLILWITYKPLKPIQTGLCFLLLTALPSILFYIEIFPLLENVFSFLAGRWFYLFWAGISAIAYGFILYQINVFQNRQLSDKF